MAKAMRRAYHLGQTYWQQADSESLSQQRKSDETQAKFDRLLTETVAALAAPGTAAAAAGLEPYDVKEVQRVNALDGARYRALRTSVSNSAYGARSTQFGVSMIHGEALDAACDELVAARAAQAQGGA